VADEMPGLLDLDIPLIESDVLAGRTVAYGQFLLANCAVAEDAHVVEATDGGATSGRDRDGGDGDDGGCHGGRDSNAKSCPRCSSNG